MTSSIFNFVKYKMLYILLIIILILVAVNDIVSTKEITFNFLSIVFFIISVGLELLTFKKDNNLYNILLGILIFTALCLQSYSHYDEDKKHNEKSIFFILLTCIFLIFAFYKMYN
jgi:hypothetical protein